jgi:hypothetical protein
MKLTCKPVFWSVSAALLLGSTCSDALTLGRVRGSALLGQPLDVSVSVQSFSEEEVGSNCFGAEVHYGDTALESSRIQVSVQPTAQANSQLVRVTSSAMVDEAVVRLTLKANCGASASRQYVLLADVVSELAGSVGSVRALPSSGTVAPPTEGRIAGGSAALTPGSIGQAPPAVSKRALPQKVNSAPKTASTPAKPAGLATPKAGSSVRTSALEELERRVDDIAKWQANSRNADDLLKSEARAQALEADMRGLKLVTAKNQQNIQMVAAALESNGSQDLGRPLVYGLGALLLVLLAVLAYVVQRVRANSSSSTPWWSGNAERTPAQATDARRTKPVPLDKRDSRPADIGNAPAQLDNATQRGGPTTLDPQSTYGTDPVELTSVSGAAAAAGAPPLAQQPVAVDRSNRSDFAPSGTGTIRAINTREMLDVRQQAEFFMALGQHDEAVRLLESNIRGSTDCNPLVFLDLLKIFHTLSRRTEFERYREEFNAQFTGRIPPYASFLLEGNGLEAYEDICNQIVVLWPTDYTIDYIEQCLVRLPEDAPEQGIDLEAFKDLLMLYGVLKRLDQGNDSGHAPFSASRVEPSPNTAPGAPMTAPQPVSAVESSAATSAMDIDLDLDLDLDISAAEVSNPQPSDSNLIDFDMSEYIAQKKADAAK